MVVKSEKTQRGAVKLRPEEVDEIFRLRAEGKSNYAIQRETGHHWKTVKKYLEREVEGYPQTPIDARVRKLRERMLQVAELDIAQSLKGDFVLLDEYRDKMAELIARGRVPAECDGGELKKIIDAKAALLRLPRELGAKRNDIEDQVQRRVARARDRGIEATAERVERIGEKVTEAVVTDWGDTDDSGSTETEAAG